MVTPFFVLQYAKMSEICCLSSFVTPRYCSVGFTVTKRLGNAVRRNRIKRRLRSIVQDIFPDHAQEGYAYVMIGRYGAFDADYTTMQRHAVKSLERIARLSRTGNAAESSHKPAC